MKLKKVLKRNIFISSKILVFKMIHDSGEDEKVSKFMARELERQEYGLEMIPSENFVSRNVLNAIGSVLTNKYSEGYPGKRHYGGNQFIDEIENLAIERAKRLFGVEHANVQPYSGSPANFAVYNAVCEPGDTIMGLNLFDGGHLTHGWKVSATSKFFKSIPYHVKADGRIDFRKLREVALQERPKLIWCGATAYVYEFEFEEFARIAEEVGAYLVADIAHVAGLVAAGIHKSPVDFVHIITTTTHKTLRGPRGALIMVTGKGLEKDPELAKKIDRSVFPGLQGGPHDHTTAGIAVALGEAAKPEFREYCSQILKNSKALAQALMKNGIKLVGQGTENHMVLLDLTNFKPGLGHFVQEALELAGITVNKNTIPKEPFSAFYPSGIRLGTPALTTRGMKEMEMEKIALWISRVISLVKEYDMPKDKDARKEVLRRFNEEIKKNPEIQEIRNKVKELCKSFPLYI